MRQNIKNRTETVMDTMIIFQANYILREFN